MKRYCITLEQAKRLVELGFTRESEFKFFENDQNYFSDTIHPWYEEQNVKDDTDVYPAYHVGELGEILKDWAIDSIVFDINPTDKPWCMFISQDIESITKEYPTEAQARGALLIYLLENRLL